MRVPAFALLALVASAAPARAERPLTLDDALALARAHNRDLAQARARLDQSGVQIEQAWVALLPSASAQGKYTHNYKEITLSFSNILVGNVALAEAAKVGAPPAQAAALDAYIQAAQGVSVENPVLQKAEQLDGALSVTVPLVVPAGYPGLQSAKRTYAAAEAGFRVSQATVLLSVAQAFYAAAGTDELLTARTHAVEVARTTVNDAQARFESGTVNRVEVTRAQLALLRAEQALEEARDNQAQAYRALATLIVLREPFKVVPAPTPPEPPAETAELAHHALELRPEIAQAERTVDAASSQRLSQLLRWAPTVSGFGQARIFNYGGFANDYYAWLVGVELDWTIYDGGARDAARHLAEAQKREALARLDLLRDTVSDEVANGTRAVATRRRALATAEESVKLSRETLDLVRAQHDAGTATQLDLLQAQDSLVGSEVSLAQARFDLALADLTLRRSAGTFPAP